MLKYNIWYKEESAKRCAKRADVPYAPKIFACPKCPTCL